MKKFLLVLTALFVLLFLFVLYTFHSTGFFRDISSGYNLNLIKEIPLTGAEDFSISRKDSFLIISSTGRKANANKSANGLYLIDLTDIEIPPVKMSTMFKRDFNPHGIYMYRLDSSSYKIWAINHFRGNHTIELFKLQDRELIHLETIRHRSLVSPNDIVAINETQFYFTNDHKYTRGIGKLAEDYLGLSLSNVIFFDGKEFIEVVDGIAYANGINYDPKRNLLFVASPRGFEVRVYSKKNDGQLQYLESIDAGTGVDNIEFDTDGNLLIGCHPNLLGFTFYMAGKNPISPSEVIRIRYHEEGDYDQSIIWLDDGEVMSASTVAVEFDNKIFVGNVTDDHFVILENQKTN